LPYDDSELTDEELRLQLARSAGDNGWDEPRMDEYDTITTCRSDAMTSSLSLTRVLDAAAFSARAHDGQLRKDQKTPYVSHVFRVCLIVRDLFGFDDPRMLMTALLHDTVEDTTTDFDEIAEKFSPEIAQWVALLTKDKRLAEDEREAAYLRQLTTAPWQVQACKLADVYDNLTDLPTMPAEKRQQSLRRTKMYLAGLEQVGREQLRQPLELTWELWHQRSGGG
jgi:(p)ppGpp synthase/HD superfamily hydrolase